MDSTDVAVELATVLLGQTKSVSPLEPEAQAPVDRKVDTGEVLLGLEPHTSAPVYWSPTKANNPHLMVMGQSGTGKTYAIQCILLELLKLGVPSVVLDYGQGFNLSSAEPEFRDAAQISEIWVGRDGVNLNPLSIRSSDVNGPKNVAVRIAGIFKRIYGGLGEIQHHLLVDAILEAFRRRHIYPDQPGTWGRPLPNMDELCTVLSDWASDEENPSRVTVDKLRSHLGTFFMYGTFTSEGAAFQWEDHLASKGVTILQLKGLDGQTPWVVTEFLLWDLFSFLESVGPTKALRLFVVLDEAHNLDFGKGTPVDKIVRESRKFGLGMILASQNPKDFSESTLLNVASKLVFYVDDEGAAQRLSKSARLDKAVIGETIASLQRGSALFISENRGTVCSILGLSQR
ncbi:MAG TPA: helicase HerA-like domain-containing protein [Symbiobacteriaceae bacterium]|nr:helicase HerA-like domain-containing protein [Symbiobacteriaceae bacterium]